MSVAAGLRVGVLDYYENGVRRQLMDEIPDMNIAFAEGPDELHRLAVAKEADVLLAGWTPVSTEVIGASPRLRLIQKMGVGVDKIDVAAARARGVRVFRAAGINADAVAEMTVLLMLAVLRELPWAVSELRDGRFQKEKLRDRTIQLAGQRVGLIGFGHIGAAVAARLQGFKVETSYHDPLPHLRVDRSLASPMSLDELLRWSDIVSLHTPLTPQTRHLLNRARIAAMRPGAVVINTARGGLVDEDALCAAINEGKLRGAGLDVTAEEPLPRNSPLLASDRVIITPHIGGAVASNFANVARRARSNILAFFAGDPVGEEDVVC